MLTSTVYIGEWKFNQISGGFSHHGPLPLENTLLEAASMRDRFTIGEKSSPLRSITLSSAGDQRRGYLDAENGEHVRATVSLRLAKAGIRCQCPCAAI
jgi:hypothetical protein